MTTLPNPSDIVDHQGEPVRPDTARDVVLVSKEHWGRLLDAIAGWQQHPFALSRYQAIAAAAIDMVDAHSPPRASNTNPDGVRD